MNDISFAVATVATIVFFLLFATGSIKTIEEEQILKTVEKLRVECEVSLPRTQHCVLQFIPQIEKENN